MDERRRRLIFAMAWLGTIFVIGALGYYALGRGEWSLLECAYMTAITLSTVGYGETLPIREVTGGVTFTILIVFAGVSAVLYSASTVMAFLLEGDLREMLGRRRMEERTRKLRGHYIVCGVGRTGRHTVNQLAQAGCQIVLVDLNEIRLKDYLAARGLDLPFVVGDATEESVLKKAGIEHASGLACALDSDQSNLYTVLTARELNSKVRIVAKATGSAASKKFRLVGADSVVAPTELGGTRLFVEMTQPGAAAFLESLLLPTNLNLTVREITVSEKSSLAGSNLVDANLRRQVGNILILAIKPPDRKEFEYNPRPTSRIEACASLMAMGAPAEIHRLQALAEGNSIE